MGLVRPGLGFVPKPPTSVEGASKVIVGLPAASSAAAVGVEEEKAAKGAKGAEGAEAEAAASSVVTCATRRCAGVGRYGDAAAIGGAGRADNDAAALAVASLEASFDPLPPFRRGGR